MVHGPLSLHPASRPCLLGSTNAYLLADLCVTQFQYLLAWVGTIVLYDIKENKNSQVKEFRNARDNR